MRRVQRGGDARSTRAAVERQQLHAQAGGTPVTHSGTTCHVYVGTKRAWRPQQDRYSRCPYRNVLGVKVLGVKVLGV